jgi:hypothetical protein
VLVAHSQGGLIVQRFLARMLRNRRGRELARIKQIVMFSCPNSGSEFLLSIRKLTVWWRHSQERQLRPFDRMVMETRETVLRYIVNAGGCTETECRIPISAYGAISDNIVKPFVSTWMFLTTGVVDGDHFSVIQPTSSSSSSYRVLKSNLMAAAIPPDGQPADQNEVFTERARRFSVAAPFGKRDAPLQGGDRHRLIAAVLSPGSTPSVHILAGMGGAGKSRLALEIAFRAQEIGRRVWWVPVTRINSCMREVANQLGAPEGQVERAWRGAGSATDLLWQFLETHPRPWVLIFDNVDDPAILGPADGQVSDGTGWLRRPASQHGMVVVTSRDRNPATWGAWSAVHVVRPLNDDDGATLLMNQVGSAAGTNEQARQLSAELGGLPLALRTAASVINASASSGETSIDSFPTYQAAVQRRFESPPGEHDRDPDEPIGANVQEVFDLSLKLLEDRGLHEAAPLLKLFACLNIAPIPYRLLLNEAVLAESTLFAEFTTMRRTIVLDGLSDLGLVDRVHLTDIPNPCLSHFLSLHPVVHGILRDDEDVQRRRDDYYALNIRMLLSAAKDPDEPESWAIWDVIAPHSLEVSCASLLGARKLDDRRVIAAALDLARLTSRYLIVTGLLKPAHDLVIPIVANCKSFGFDKNDREILAMRHEKARIDLEQGDPVAAEAELREVIAGRTRLLGENHPNTLASGHKLAKAILEQGRWAEAEPLLRSIVEAEKKVRGPEHSDTIVVRHSLARAILAQNRGARAAEAEVIIRDILQVCNRRWPPTNPETLFVRLTLARSLLEQKKYRDAEAELRDALRDAASRPDAPRVLSLRHTLTQAMLMQGRWQEAQAEATRLLADRTRVLGENHPDRERTRVLLERINGIFSQMTESDIPPNGELPAIDMPPEGYRVRCHQPLSSRGDAGTYGLVASSMRQGIAYAAH